MPRAGSQASAIGDILGFYALMVRPGQTLQFPVRSPAMVFHLIEGEAEMRTPAEQFELAKADTCCVPGYTAVSLHNRSSIAPAFNFMADETPSHRKLGVSGTRR